MGLLSYPLFLHYNLIFRLTLQFDDQFVQDQTTNERWFRYHSVYTRFSVNDWITSIFA